MTEFRNIIGRWPTLRAFQADIESEHSAALQMRHRNKVSSRYWTKAVAGARRRGIPLSLEELALASQNHPMYTQASAKVA
jgi:hypothetical protein